MEPLSPRNQYERFPYPPIPWFAVPRPTGALGDSARFETGTRLATGQARSHAGIRILVAGAGTWEALAIAKLHPRAHSVTAVDWSESSLRILRRRDRLARVTGWMSGGFPRLQTVAADLGEWQPTERYDYITASNVLHHVADPAALLGRLASWLSPQGVLRMITYPRASRVWMRATGRTLRARGLSAESPDLVRRAAALIARLPATNPVRSCFESQPERGRAAGLVDAFFHALENPLAPLEWQDAVARAGLECVGELQTETSRSDFLVELLPPTAALNRWQRLQVMDDLLELCANPVLWLARARAPSTPLAFPFDFPALDTPTNQELGASLRRAETLLALCGVTLDDARAALVKQVGPRVTAQGGPLPGLSLVDYDWEELLSDGFEGFL